MMKDLLPFQPPVDADMDETRVLSLTGESADEVFSALSSATARQILDALYETPRPANELADHTDTSVQNVRYHLDRMLDAGLVMEADTWYSERGNEMQVYAPSDKAVVLAGGEPGVTERIREVAPKFIGLVGILGVISLFVQVIFERFFMTEVSTGGGSSEGPSIASDAPPQSEAWTETVFAVEPGIVFFVGCLTGLAVIGAFVLLLEWYGYGQSDDAEREESTL